ncbi:MAG: VOC family protein [Bacteroidota bacterium]|jgi:predicted enzyme related to lactoylglutathione lyase
MSSKRVTGIGGIFFKCKDPANIRRWYKRHLGLNTSDHGTTFEWRRTDKPDQKGFSVWAPFPETTEYFKPSEKKFMINFRVDKLESLLVTLKEEGVTIIGGVEVFEYGKFAHIIDPEGNKVELWEPNDIEYEKVAGKARTY